MMQFLKANHAMLILGSVLNFNITTFAEDKVIHGQDNRKDLYEVSNQNHLNWAKSTAVIGTKKQLTELDTNTYSLYTAKYKDTYNLCDRERFSNQLQGGHCSGFLVGPDIFVTAGHCIDKKETCANTAIMFDFGITQAGQNSPTKLSKNSVFFCKEIIATINVMQDDFAVIKLDRPTNRTPLKYRTDSYIANETDLVLIGYPHGLPTKVAEGAYVTENQYSNYFRANTDGYSGNSGSGIFDANTGMIEGVLILGDIDFAMDSTGCNVSVVKPNESGRQGISRSTEFAKFLPSSNINTKLVSKELTNLNRTIPDNDLNGITYNIDLTEDLEIINAKLSVDIDHENSSDIVINVTDPLGNSKNVKFTMPTFVKDFKEIIAIPFASKKRSKGIWKVKITDIGASQVGKINSIKFDLLTKV